MEDQSMVVEAVQVSAPTALTGTASLFQVAHASVGPSPYKSRLKVFLLEGDYELPLDPPPAVLLQPRQVEWDGGPRGGYPDQFSVQLVGMSRRSMTVAVMRLDADSGWAQDLYLDMVIYPVVPVSPVASDEVDVQSGTESIVIRENPGPAHVTRMVLPRGVRFARIPVELSTTPRVVLVQPRQIDPDEFFPDQFAAQVKYSEISVLVRRIDSDTGWGQKLGLDVLIVE